MRKSYGNQIGAFKVGDSVRFIEVDEWVSGVVVKPYDPTVRYNGNEVIIDPSKMEIEVAGYLYVVPTEDVEEV